MILNNKERKKRKEVDTLCRALKLKNDDNTWEEVSATVGISDRKLRRLRTAYENKTLLPEPSNILVVGDLHHPFCLEDYLEFCKKAYSDWGCDHVVFIGDIIDQHFSSYHETDPDGMSAGDELELSIDRLQPWIEAFPIADVCIGNHDRMVRRKAFSGGIPKAWIKEYKEVLGCPGWTFDESFIYHDVKYIHGEGGTARNRMKKDLHSVVQGHLHTQGYINYQVGDNYKIFGMQVGCGIDHKAYAMAYAKNFGKPVISCAVVLNNGTLPILIMADLEDNQIKL